MQSIEEAENHINELSQLVDTMGIEVIEKKIVKIKKMNPRFLLGKGKIEEIVSLAKEKEADIIIFDDDLKPTQQRNIEELSGMAVIDRHEVILDIFVDRAKTREAMLQVQLARLQYSLPRLKRAWTHLSRQRGGARGTRGEGEMQLEVDRRIVLRKIVNVKKELKEVGKQRAIKRSKRQRVPVPSISLVGYTNAGKSSLLKALTDADVFIEDKLFATLDPTTRRIELDNGQKILLTDTVGFIRKLPHDLVEAFKSTLEETVVADFLLHILDVSSPEVEEHYQTTLSVLDEINAINKPSIMVFNKIDLLEKNPGIIERFRQLYPEALYISTKTKEGFEDLKKAIIRLLAPQLTTVNIDIPVNRYDLVTFIHRNGKVLAEEYDEEFIHINCLVTEKIGNMLKEKVKIKQV